MKRYICVECGGEMERKEHTDYTVWTCLHCGLTIKLSEEEIKYREKMEAVETVIMTRTDAPDIILKVT